MTIYRHKLDQIKSLNISEYVLLTRRYIQKYSHVDNGPFFLEGTPDKPLIILIHGFSASAYSMRSLANEFNNHGYNCFAPLLLGHGSTPNDLLNIPYQDWFEQIEYFITQASLKYQSIHLVGHSYGGLLATLLARKYPKIIKSLILFAPVFSLSSRFVLYLTPFVEKLGQVIPVKPFTHVKSLCGKDKFSYNEYPMQSAVEVIKQIKKAKKSLKEPLEQPIFMVISTEDETVSFRHACDYFKTQSNPLSHLVIYSSSEHIRENDHRITLINSKKLSALVIDFSHLGMQIDINDPHYGINGNYYLNKKDSPMIFGALTIKNKLKIRNLKRLAFNPNFYDLANKIEHFLNQF